MVAEQLIFTILAFVLFVIMFFKMIKNNDTTYIAMLIIQALGIAINFIGATTQLELNTAFKIIMWIMSVMLPIAVIILEKMNISFMESIQILKANIYVKVGDTKKAKQVLLQILDKNPESYKAHKMLAEVYEIEGGMRKAIDEYVKAIDINKTDYDSYYKVADLLNNLDKKDEASEMLVSLLNKKPNYLEATELLGNIYIEKDMYKEAVNIYQDALKYNQTNYDLYYSLGIAYTMLNDFQNAKISYEKAAELNSLLYNAQYSLAEIALIYKDLDEAEKRFLQAIEENELSADAYFELSKISMVRGDKETAIKYANVAIDTDASKVVNKIKNDSIFIPIFARLSIPFNIEEKEEKTIFTIKELKAKEHLENMFEITRNLSYNDIKLLKKTEGKHKEIKEENKTQEQNQKEIQE